MFFKFDIFALFATMQTLCHSFVANKSMGFDVLNPKSLRAILTNCPANLLVIVEFADFYVISALFAGHIFTINGHCLAYGLSIFMATN